MSPSAPRAPSRPSGFDIFCKVIDNYGDIGVTWRLARQLASEHGARVRLWVDELESLERLCPQAQASLAQQSIAGVDVRRWDDSADAAQPHDVVIEAFGCQLPAAFLASMASRATPAVWINLEYLSAEDWVEGCHGLPSLQAASNLRKYFFFPGFTSACGGLLRERSLLDERDAFQASAVAQGLFWRRIGVPARAANEWRVSLFCYANAPVDSLLSGLAAHPHPVHLVVTQGPAAIQVADWFGVSAQPGTSASLGNLAVSIIPFIEQDDYDRLLWGCDLNFVRGEDSFVRAQWAGRPLVWQIYPQSGGVHEPKLAEFVRRYAYGLHEPRREAIDRYMRHWNRLPESDLRPEEVWRSFAANQSTLRLHAEEWAWKLAEQPDLARQLVEFVEKTRRSGL
jgi:uncharacterized repeat protein (TIGR03837 family)